MKGWRFVLSARWFGYFALVVAFGFACYLLGNWQFSRLHEAQAAIKQLESNYDKTPVDLNELLTGLQGFNSTDEWRQVVITGSYLEGKTLLVRTRPLNGEVGFEVLVPLLTTSGNIFFVDRGWIATAKDSAEPVSVPATPKGEVQVVARLKPTEPAIPGRSAPKGQLASIELAKAAKVVDAPAFTGAYGLLVSESPSVSKMPTPIPKPDLDEGPHLSYALQWIAFAILAVIGLVWAIRQEHRIRSADDPRIIRQEARREAKRALRGPTDAEVEDAILDGSEYFQANSTSSE